MLLRPKDDLFHAGALAHEAYSVAQGTLVYTAQWFQVSTSGDIKETASEVCTGCWICEAASWVQWIHVGRLEAVTEWHLLSVSAEASRRSGAATCCVPH